MNKQESLQMMAILKAAYPNAYNGMTRQEASSVVAVWALQFANIPAEIVYIALQKAIATSKFPPTVYEVKNKLESVYWEAYEALNNRQIREIAPLTEAQRERYQWIYDNTKSYRCAADMEPKIDMILPTWNGAGPAAIGGGINKQNGGNLNG